MATSAHSAMPAGGPGSRSNTTMVGDSMSAARAMGVWSSRAARLAAHTRAGRVVEHAVVDGTARVAGAERHRRPTRAGATGTASRRTTCPSTPLGKRRKVTHRPARWVSMAGRDRAVVVDHLALGEPHLGVEHLVEVGDGQLAAVDLDGGAGRAGGHGSAGLRPTLDPVGPRRRLLGRRLLGRGLLGRRLLGGAFLAGARAAALAPGSLGLGGHLGTDSASASDSSRPVGWRLRASLAALTDASRAAMRSTTTACSSSTRGAMISSPAALPSMRLEHRLAVGVVELGSGRTRRVSESTSWRAIISSLSDTSIASSIVDLGDLRAGR